MFLFPSKSLTRKQFPLCSSILTLTTSLGIFALLYSANFACSSIANSNGSSGPYKNPIQQPSPVGNNNNESIGTDLNDLHSEMHLFDVSIFFFFFFVDIEVSDNPTISTKKKFA